MVGRERKREREKRTREGKRERKKIIFFIIRCFPVFLPFFLASAGASSMSFFVSHVERERERERNQWERAK